MLWSAAILRGITFLIDQAGYVTRTKYLVRMVTEPSSELVDVLACARWNDRLRTSGTGPVAINSVWMRRAAARRRIV